MTFVALTIAGSDCSGGAGLQADLKTFHQHSVYGMSVVTLVTAQNTRGVRALEHLPPRLILQQLGAVLSDIEPRAAKTGALGRAEAIEAVAHQAARFEFPLVVDPVMFSKTGQRLIDDDAIELLGRRLLPLAALITPNIAEAAALSGIEINDLASMRSAAAELAARGAAAVLVKGGGLEGRPIDLLWTPDGVVELDAARIDSPHTHGSGCVLSAAITARLARGESLTHAVSAAKKFVTAAIQTAPGLGRGRGPLNLHAAMDG